MMEWNENLQLAQFTKQRESLHVDVTNAVPLEDPAKNNNNNKKKKNIYLGGQKQDDPFRGMECARNTKEYITVSMVMSAITKINLEGKWDLTFNQQTNSCV